MLQLVNIMIYLHLSSKDSLHFHPNNVWYDFTIELPSTISGSFRCGLLEFFSTSSMQEDLYIFSDICEPEFIHDSLLPLLRIVTEPGEMSIPHFKSVSRKEIQRIRVYIRNKNLVVPDLNIGIVRMTLALESI